MDQLSKVNRVTFFLSCTTSTFCLVTVCLSYTVIPLSFLFSSLSFFLVIFALLLAFLSPTIYYCKLYVLLSLPSHGCGCEPHALFSNSTLRGCFVPSLRGQVHLNLERQFSSSDLMLCITQSTNTTM